MITEPRVEIQSNGVDQEMEDNVANWLFFSNYKDAIPIHQNGRRYSIFYSAIQTIEEFNAAGMGQDYFNSLWGWLKKENGYQHVTNWLLNYPIEEGDIPVRAPETTSHAEALRISRSPMEVVIRECISDEIAGFRGGYVSSLAVKNRCKDSGMRTPSSRAIQSCLESMGFHEIGKCYRAYAQDDVRQKPILYSSVKNLDPNGYGVAQGYE